MSGGEGVKHVRSELDRDRGAVSAADYDAGWTQWADMVKYSPAPFHRRRLILDLAAGVPFRTVLDVGCGTGELVQALHERFPQAAITATDLSSAVIEADRKRLPYAEFRAGDIAVAPLAGTWELIVCSEVIEHIKDYPRALQHLRAMCSGHLIVTVPSGRIFPIDLQMGHHQHFSAQEMCAALERAGFTPLTVWRWGFPWHTAYKHLINASPDAAMNRFGSREYTRVERLIARALTTLFYLNTKRSGLQLIVLARAA